MSSPEVDSDFADVLLSFLTLPLGTIMKILEKHYGDETAPVIGSLNSLRKGLADLNDVHFWTKGGKLMLLNPISSLADECCKLKLNIDHDTQPAKYFTCEDLHCNWRGSSGVRMYYDTARCQCGKLMNRQIGIRESISEAPNNDHGVFAKITVSFAISDDLQVAPNVTGSIIQILRNFGITDIDGAEQISLTLGLNEIMDLLKGLLVSKTPLTDLILNKRQTDVKFESSTLKESTSNSKKMVIKAIVQKSTKKLLFAIAKENFIDFLFSLLTIPLGGVASLVGSNTCLGSVDNLYRSISNLNGEEYLKTKDMESMLLKPELPPMLKIPLLDIKEIEFEIGLEEALNILGASLTSTCALTNGLMIKRVLMKQPKEEQ
ncbi:hypothetical protein BUALT_Bualt03G0210300 [Buddleja alternifolia]|uniref:DUF674 domain-containing protein n=1 Tax=Buddleja alternifolia TaxID=168488 RepID=A0AAV6XVI3_9LAMI|nr:hypothetical protein BUALT_Bualt03G0210300 [Buddleja alternifolia]